MGKTVYLTDLEVEMLQLAFAPENCSFEGYEEEEAIKRYEAAENIVRKVSK